MRGAARAVLISAALLAACDRPETLPRPFALSAFNVQMEVTGDAPPSYPLTVIGTEPELPTPSVSVAYGGEWLAAEMREGREPYWIDLRPKTAAFETPGYYTSIVSVHPPGSEDRWVTVNTFVKPPSFEASTHDVRFQMAPGGDLPAARTVTVTRASGPGGLVVPDPALSLHDETCGEWVEAAVTSSGAGWAVTLSPVAWAVSGLALGTECHVGVELTFTFPAPPQGGIEEVASTYISATLAVQDAVSPLLEVSRSSLSFSWSGPASQSVTVADALGSAFTPPPPVSVSASWLSARVSGTRSPYVVTVWPRSWELPAGSYQGEVIVGVPGSPSSDRIAVSLELESWVRTAWTLVPAMGLSLSEVYDGRAIIAGGRGPGWFRDPGFRLCEQGFACGEVTYGTGRMLTPRLRHTATVSAARLLAAGGVDPETGLPVGSWEIYWWPIAWYVERPLATPRFAHTATLLADGTVLVAGGAVGSESDPIAIADAEILDPGGAGGDVYAWDAHGWRIAPMTTPRRDASAVRLPDGKVLVAGGQVVAGAALASAELFDPVSGTWSLTRSMNEPRANAALVLLDDGRVLAAGGTDGQRALATAEIYDPVTATWSYTGSMALGRVAPAVRLGNGTVLLVAGLTGEIGARVVTGTVERFDPATETWSSAGSLHVPRTGHAVAVVGGAGVVVAGGTTALPWSDATLVADVEVGTAWIP